jgi:hypothetical protein
MIKIFEDYHPKEGELEDVSIFLTHGQNPQIVQHIYPLIRSMLMYGERLIFIFHQIRVLLPMAVVFTTERVILCKPNIIGGMDVKDYLWKYLALSSIHEGPFFARIEILRRNEYDNNPDFVNPKVIIPWLPKEQARRANVIAQQTHEVWVEIWRYRDHEKNQAASGGVVFKGALASMNYSYRNPMEPMGLWPNQKASLDDSKTALPSANPTTIPLANIMNPKPIGETDFEKLNRQVAVPQELQGQISPTARLAKLKEMFELKLVSQEEYDAKRTEILESI